MSDVRLVAWKDSVNRRHLHTAVGSIVVEKGETAIVIIGRNFDAAVLKALGVEMVIVAGDARLEPPK